MNIQSGRLGRSRGFSLIEILIAVVVLSTGLLALTALQGRLAQASAEAKVRSRVAAMLTSRMDALRATAYESTALVTASPQTCSGGAPAWICTAQAEAAISGLSVGQTVTRYSSESSLNDPTPEFSDSGPAAGMLIPEFKRVTLSATWNDSAGSGHRMSMSTDMSPLSLTANLIPPAGGGGGGSNPIVRQESPEEAGVIPIALGNGDNTAATNPKPVVVGRDSTLIETKYNVLTYKPDGAGVRIQDRVETTVIACRCSYGNQSQLTGIFTQNYRPTYWEGNRYAAPKVAPTGPTAGPVVIGNSESPQSSLCTDCCRDHHDDGVAADAVKFDASNSGHNHYLSPNLSSPVSSGEYSEACRVIRVDGFWRVATDLRVSHFDYIGTNVEGTTVKEQQAPADSLLRPYKKNYQDFVKDYLDQRFVSGTNPDAYSLYNTSYNGPTGGKPTKPASLSIIAGQQRYQHTHAVLVDDIEAPVNDVIERACGQTKSSKCVLPHIPFTSINLTELAKYLPSNDRVISVVDGGANFSNSAIIQGLVTGLSTAPQGSNDVTSNATSKLSNSALSAVLAIDPGDATLTPVALHAYSLTNGVPTNGEWFAINLYLGNAPDVLTTMNNQSLLDDPGLRIPTVPSPCSVNSVTATNPFTCVSPAGLAAGDVTVVLSGYNIEIPRTGQQLPNNLPITCVRPDGSTVAATLGNQETVNVCKHYSVAENAAYTIGAVTGQGKGQTTGVSFSGVTSGSSRSIFLSEQVDTYSYTCRFNNANGANKTVTTSPCP